jgi:hypothetical protein
MDSERSRGACHVIIVPSGEWRKVATWQWTERADAAAKTFDFARTLIEIFQNGYEWFRPDSGTKGPMGRSKGSILTQKVV